MYTVKTLNHVALELIDDDINKFLKTLPPGSEVTSVATSFEDAITRIVYKEPDVLTEEQPE